MENNIAAKVTYWAVGLGMGALIGIFCAPKSGEETRKFLAQKAEEGPKYAHRKVRQQRERAKGFVERKQAAAWQN